MILHEGTIEMELGLSRPEPTINYLIFLIRNICLHYYHYFCHYTLLLSPTTPGNTRYLKTLKRHLSTDITTIRYLLPKPLKRQYVYFDNT